MVVVVVVVEVVVEVGVAVAVTGVSVRGREAGEEAAPFSETSAATKSPLPFTHAAQVLPLTLYPFLLNEPVLPTPPTPTVPHITTICCIGESRQGRTATYCTHWLPSSISAPCSVPSLWGPPPPHT